MAIKLYVGMRTENEAQKAIKELSGKETDGRAVMLNAGATKKDFLNSEAGASARAELQRMVQISTYTTNPAHDVILGQSVLFVDRHISYLAKHPHVNPASYITNLKVMTKAHR